MSYTHYKTFPDTQTEGEMQDVVILYFDTKEDAQAESDKWGGYHDPRLSTKFPGQWFLRFDP